MYNNFDEIPKCFRDKFKIETDDRHIKKAKTAFTDFINALNRNNDTLISDYTGNSNKIKIQWNECGHITETIPKSYKNGYRCSICGHKKVGDAQRGKPKTEEHKQNMSKGATGKKRKAPTNETRAKISKANMGKLRTEETKRKLSNAAKLRTGNKNPNYNPHLTKEEREQGRLQDGYNEWVKQIKKSANYTCDCCSKHGCVLHSHHLDGYHWCIERRLDITNGVCLCEKCHKKFHKLYGCKNNTEQQYIEFKQQIANGSLD